VGKAIPPQSLLLDVGSADGPSVRWLDELTRRVPLDIDLSALRPGDVCGSGAALPFREGSFDAVCAFDVVEHFADDTQLLVELARALGRRGCLAVSVPAYQWGWSDFDVRAGHYRRYNGAELRAALESAGLETERETYAFAGTIPFFVAERVVLRRLSRRTDSDPLPAVPRWLQRIFMAVLRFEEGLIRQGIDMPFGSSVVMTARKRS
jgi:SAM-dependent methyltransferase